MTANDLRWYTSSHGLVEFQMTLDDAKSASHQGQCDDDVAALLQDERIKRQLDKIRPDAIREELKGYGAWSAEELADDAENRARIVWIAAGDIVEEDFLSSRK